MAKQNSEAILDYLKEHPLSSSREIYEGLRQNMVPPKVPRLEDIHSLVVKDLGVDRNIRS